MARLDEKNVASVKKTVSVAAPTGPLFSQFQQNQGRQLLRNAMVPNETIEAAVGNKPAAVKGKGGKLTKISTPVKGVANVQAIKNKLTGKPTTPAKSEEFKMGTYNLPEVVRIGGYSVEVKDVKQALKKILSTYGESSKEFKNFMSSTGANLSKDYEILSFTGSDTYKKPDLRKDPKSYVDTAQVSHNQSTLFDRRNPSPYLNREYKQDANIKSDDETVTLLNKLGYDVFKRNLKFDKESTGYKK
jgi:hypothetical protein